MIRDKRKDADYFDAYITYQLERINNKEMKLEACGDDEEKKQRIYLSLSKYKIDLLFAEYSAGYERSHLIDSFHSSIDTIIEMKELDYESMLNTLSMAVFLDEKYKLNKLYKQHDDLIQNDKLLRCLYNYIVNWTIVWEGTLTIPHIYDTINDIAVVENKATVLNEYLDTWYSNRRELSWYDSHKSNNDIYVGYWSFESAALAQIFGIEDQKLRENEYYPIF